MSTTHATPEQIQEAVYYAVRNQLRTYDGGSLRALELNLDANSELLPVVQDELEQREEG